MSRQSPGSSDEQSRTSTSTAKAARRWLTDRQRSDVEAQLRVRLSGALFTFERLLVGSLDFLRELPRGLQAELLTQVLFAVPKDSVPRDSIGSRGNAHFFEVGRERIGVFTDSDDKALEGRAVFSETQRAVRVVLTRIIGELPAANGPQAIVGQARSAMNGLTRRIEELSGSRASRVDAALRKHW